MVWVDIAVKQLQIVAIAISDELDHPWVFEVLANVTVIVTSATILFGEVAENWQSFLPQTSLQLLPIALHGFQSSNETGDELIIEAKDAALGEQMNIKVNIARRGNAFQKS